MSTIKLIDPGGASAFTVGRSFTFDPLTASPEQIAMAIEVLGEGIVLEAIQDRSCLGGHGTITITGIDGGDDDESAW